MQRMLVQTSDIMYQGVQGAPLPFIFALAVGLRVAYLYEIHLV